MRKKYLSALLFGALLFASAGTFTSCKDYDDDIKNLQGQIDANADAIKALQDLVNNGDYVTAVKKSDDGKGIVFTFSKSGDQTVTLDIENGQEGDVLSIDPTTGELLKNGEPTGIKPATDPEEVKAPVKAENGVWVFLNDKGEYESTNIPVSGVTAVQNENKQWVLTITDANGAQSTVVVPSAASVMSDLVLAGWIDGTAIGDDGKLSTSAINTTFGGTTDNKESLPIEYCYITAITKDYDGDKETTWSAQKDVVKGQVLTSLRGLGVQLVTRVAPADLDLSSMKFTLQDSEGNALPITLNPSENFDGTLTRAANSSINLIPLDITTNTYANEKAYTDLYGANDGNTLYSLVEESGARSNYGLAVKATKATVTQQYVSEVDGDAPISGTAGVNANPTFEVDLNKANKLTFDTKPEYVYDYYVEPVDKAVADLFGVQIDKKAGTFTVTKLSDQITRTTFELYVYALHIDGKIYRDKITIKPSNKIVASATLAAGEQVIKQSVQSDGKTIDKANHMRFDISLDAMFNAMSDADKAKWTSATLGANEPFDITKVVIGGSEETGKEETAAPSDYYDIELLDADGKVISNDDEYYKAKTMRVYAKYRSQISTTTPLLEVGKEYELTINFKHENTEGDTEILNTVKMTYTPVLPALSDYMQKHPSFWNDDQTVLMGVDNSINEKFTASGLTLDYAIKDGFKKLGSDKVADDMDITFKLADNKVDNKEFVEFDESASTQTVKYTAPTAKDNKNYGKEFTVKVDDVTYLSAYKYSAEELAAQTFKMKVLSPIVEGNVEVKDGTAVEVFASRNAKLNIADLIGYNYNKQSYNLYMDVDADDDGKKAYEVSASHPTADDYADKAIDFVKFESGDEQVFKITENMMPVDSSEGTPATWNGTTKSVDAGYVTLDTSNVSQNTETTIKVTVTDIWGYEKTVEVPLLIKMAE
ncbi:hypothetical protein Bacsa_2199 [Phocaeicola salanitronis DSM 18170]|uniref:DUF4988 domain-containing protein n=1 Tax=Phocaeicola salanitronis (strain DSM 18170 / JCM 13657 / CCUG 60908 / BL78) TaxID=667015 RepID=F0R505_PHOSB|nr:hypothetical protein [Phocaeicola salanitronis]ADY36752.1 hypothetical protein Bacsa_2199 [Phocaeicola salanitronis DSM 18170]